MLRHFVWTVSVLFPLLSSAQSNSALPSVDSMAVRLRRQLALYPQEKIYLHTDKPYYMAGDTIRFRAHVVDAASHAPVHASRYVYVDFRRVDKPPVGQEAPAPQRFRILERNGVYAGYIPLPMTFESGNYEITCYTHFMRNTGNASFYRQSVYVSDYRRRYEYRSRNRDASSDYDVSFHPEGGYLTAGVPCTVGFKALREDGTSVDVTGEIVDDGGNTVARFASLHAGMGKFLFTPDAAQRYYAECRTSDGMRHRFRLPDVQSRVCVLRVFPTSERFTVQASATPGYDPGVLHLLIHCRGELCYYGTLNPRTHKASFRWRDFPQGVLQILLLDNGLQTLSERLLFHYDPRGEATARVQPDRKEYGRREKVKLELDFHDAEGRPLKGNVSVSVTDDRIVAPDIMHRDIRTQLLLESELKGYIEEPDYYFGERTAERMAAADALMLTQGWRRYDIPQVVQGLYEEPAIPLEIGQEITGRIEKTGIFRKRNFKGYTVSALVPRFGRFFRTDVDQEGRFALNGFDFPDSTHFVLRAEGPGEKTDVLLLVDGPAYPAADEPRPLYDRSREMKRYDRNVAAFTDSLKHILIEEIVVAASQESLKPIENPYQVLARKSVDYREIEKGHYADLEELLMRLHGVQVRAGQITVFRQPVRYMIDGVLWEPLPPIEVVDPASGEMAYQFEIDNGMPDFIPVEMIKRIDIIPAVNSVLTGVDRLQTSRASDNNKNAAGLKRYGRNTDSNSSAIISITTKNGSELLQEEVVDFEQLHMRVVVPQGYQTPLEFYSPKYETARQRNAPERDLRTTLYWNPAFEISPEGRAEIEFYTADEPADYSIRIEGILHNEKYSILHRTIKLE